MIDSHAKSASVERMWEGDDLPMYVLPEAVAAAYDGGIGFPDDCVYANFVESLDGVTALDPQHKASGGDISGNNSTDKFVMGLLRACADAVVIGAGTFRVQRSHSWSASSVAPGFDAEWKELRATVGREADPRLVVVTASGDVDAKHPGFQSGALVLTTDAGKKQIGNSLPATCAAVSLGDEIQIRDVVAAIRAEGHRVVLCEGGPHLFGQLLAARCIDELFLTLSPSVAGRTHDDGRFGLVEGVHLVPDVDAGGKLVSVRRAESHLFLRYSFSGA